MTPDSAPRGTPPPSAVLAALGTAAVALTIVLFGVLHVVPPSSHIDPARRTISQYALLNNGWAFDLAVVVLAAGSLAVLAALVSARLIAAISGAATGLLLWALGLLGVVWFEKHNWAVGPSVEGDIHRIASVVAFLSLPVAAMLAARRWRRDPRWQGYARAAAAAAVLSLLCLAPVAAAIAVQPWTGVPWWRAVPLGAVERILGLCEVATVLVLARWAVRAGGAAPIAVLPAQPGSAPVPAPAGGDRAPA